MIILKFDRIITYNDSTRPIIDHYDTKGLVRKIDASGTPDTVSINPVTMIQFDESVRNF